ncbi:MAG: hypothetical protein AAFP84_20795, partial [Actinomycetota bacterium]
GGTAPPGASTTTSAATTSTTSEAVPTTTVAPATTTASATTTPPDATTTTSTSTTTTTSQAPTTTTIPDDYDEQQCPGDGRCIVIERVSIEGGEYVIRWNSSFTPSVAGDHAHFFWDVHEPSQVGSASADQAPWELTDATTFVPSGEMRRANRPEGANGICATAADADHAVIDPSFYSCVWIPPNNEQIAQEAIDAGLDVAELYPDLLD